jgi:hypothetical protein
MGYKLDNNHGVFIIISVITGVFVNVVCYVVFCFLVEMTVLYPCVDLTLLTITSIPTHTDYPLVLLNIYYVRCTQLQWCITGAG